MTTDRQAAPRPKKFFFLLDGIRGLAALLVVLRHIPQFLDNPFPESYLAVDLFFVLSGVVISQAYEQRLSSELSVLQFTWLRIARLYPLYLLGAVLSLMATLGFGTGLVRDHLLAYSVLAVFMIPNPGIGVRLLFPLNVPAWSLFFELLVNVIYAMIQRFLTTRLLLLIMGGSALGLMFLLYKLPNHSLDSQIAGLFRVGYSFFAGVLIYRWFSQKKGLPLSPSSPYLGSFAILAFVGAVLMAAPSVWAQPYFDCVVVLLLFPVTIYLALWYEAEGWLARICKFLGAISYAAYALHQPLGFFLYGLLKRPAPNPWGGLAFVILLLPLCWWIGRVYDAPLRRFMLVGRMSWLTARLSRSSP